MNINFATCDRRNALGFIQKVYPSLAIADTAECAGPLLDFVERDVVRVQDPMMHGSQIAVIPGTHWADEHQAGVVAAGKRLSDFVAAARAA